MRGIGPHFTPDISEPQRYREVNLITHVFSVYCFLYEVSAMHIKEKENLDTSLSEHDVSLSEQYYLFFISSTFLHFTFWGK